MPGVKGRSGRRKSIARQIIEAEQLLDESLVNLYTKLIILAESGDREALIYLIDRKQGRPRQEIDQRIKQLQLTVSGDDLARLSQQIELAETKLLNNTT